MILLGLAQVCWSCVTETVTSSHQTSERLWIRRSSEPASKGAGDDTCQVYHQLQRELYVVTLAATGIISAIIWCFYSPNTVLNYLVGACAGVVYLRMLAKDVERLGDGQKRLGISRFAPFIGLVILAAQWEQLELIPAFLGFLTYKLALIIYTVRTVTLNL